METAANSELFPIAMSTESIRKLRLSDAVKILKASIEKLDQRSQSFAQSLISQHEGRGRGLSFSQADWVFKLLERAFQPKPEAKEIGDMSGAIAIFDKAGQKLKYPAVVISTGDVTVRLSVAGEHSSRPGTINVTSNGDYNFRTWYGRITREGSFEPSAKTNPGQEIANLLVEFAAEPAKVAARHGKLTGCCSFCQTKLTDERSLFVGYGATCAKHYGLPYPKKSELDSLAAEAQAEAA